MIILVTGTPGSGKSLYTVSELLAKQFKDRPLYINGIPDLLLEHEPLTDEDVENWYDGRVPVNSVIVIDEVQRIWRPRSASVKPPEHITKLETHRHQGIDFVIITQHPQQMDAHVRRLVGRHLHIRRTWGLAASVVYEWDSTSSLSNIKTAQSKVWRYPKSAYKLYKSSQLHTKAGGKIPFVVWVVVGVAVLFPLVGWQATKRVLVRFTGDGTEAVERTGGPKRSTAPTSPGQQPANRDKQPLTVGEYTAQYQPRVAGVLHSAPAYDQLTQVKQVPLPAACIESKKPDWVKKMGGSCGCFTQTGSRYTTTQDYCLAVVHNVIFLPFVDPKPAQTAQGAATPPVAPPVQQAAPVMGSFGGGAARGLSGGSYDLSSLN
jgi:zona occludens toxin